MTATRPDWIGLWSQAGKVAELSPHAVWWDSVPREEWPEDPESRLGIACQFEGEYGDRRQELVFIGRNLDESAMRSALDACLLTDEEMEGGPQAWAALHDPLPAWPTPEEALEGPGEAG